MPCPRRAAAHAHACRGCAAGQVQQVARHAFAELVARAAACDRIRGVLALLRRYESLFRLPTRIRHASERGSYDQARACLPRQNRRLSPGGAYAVIGGVHIAARTALRKGILQWACEQACTCNLNARLRLAPTQL